MWPFYLMSRRQTGESLSWVRPHFSTLHFGFPSRSFGHQKDKNSEKNKRMLSPARAEEAGGGRVAAKPWEGGSKCGQLQGSGG